MIYVVTTNSTVIELVKEIDMCEVIGVEQSLNLLSQCKILQFDTETTSTEARIGTLLTLQFGSKKQNFQIVVDCLTVNPKLYKEILEPTLLVGHNLKFDLQWLYNYGIIPRKIYDTMIVEQLLYLGYPSGMKHYSLQAVAQERLSIYLDKSIRAEISTRGLDAETIKYAAKDVVYLEDIMHSQIAECKEKECLEAAKIECNFIPAIAYLEWCGIKLDKKKWQDKMDNDSKRLKESLEQLNKWFISTCEQYPNLKKYIFIDRQGDLFTGFNTDPQVSLNWSSSQQVIEVAKTLGFNVTVQDKKTGEDKESVLEKTLKTQKGINDDFLNLYFDYQGAAKVCSTYGQGHLNAINPLTGRIHTVFRAIGASSGRMSCGSNNPNISLATLNKVDPKTCKYPNLQQLPHDEETRACFVAEDGNLFCSCDYSAEEARLAGDIYKDEAIIEMFQKGYDSHSVYAKIFFKEELKDIDVHDVKKLRPDLRTKAKGPEFALNFGGSEKAIIQSIGCTEEEAHKIIQNYEEGFQGTVEFAKNGSYLVRKNGYVLINPITGHKMYWWDHDAWLREQETFTPQFWEEYRLKHKGTGDAIAMQVKQHFQAASKYDRMARNSPCQGTAAIILKEAATKLFNWVIDNNLFNIVKFCVFVHDEINIEYPKTMPEIANKLKEIMEETAAKYCKSLPIPAQAEVSDHWIH